MAWPIDPKGTGKVLTAKRKNGSTLAETAAAMVVLLPVVVCLIFVVLEASQAYLIQQSLDQAAREAARNLAVQYGQNNSIAASRITQDTLVFDGIRIHNVVNASSQFEDPTWDTSGSPPTVSVKVDYTSGKNGLPTFPNPDPLHLGSHFQLSGSSTYRLE